MTLLAAENVSVMRGGRAILKDVSFQAYAGEFLAVLGPNGAGKSTLLKVLAGLMKPSTGRVMLDAKAMPAYSTRQLAARRAYLPQNPHLVRPLVGYEPRRVLLPAMLAGALLLLCADIAARLIHTNPELQLGVFTSLLGTPFFFWLVVRIRKVAP